MKKTATTALLAGLILVLAGCRFGGVVIGNIVTGPTVTEQIDVPVPAGGATTDLVIGMGGGELNLEVGEIDALVRGKVDYNVAEIKPGIEVQGNRVRVEQGDIEGKRIPIGNWADVENRWDLTLGTSPMLLTVNAGAARARLSRLADLNAGQITFKGGAGDFRLEFSGTLRQDMQVSIEAGAAQIALIVPEGTSAELSFQGALTNIVPRGDWQKVGDRYVLAGEGLTITFVVQMGVGRLELSNR